MAILESPYGNSQFTITLSYRTFDVPMILRPQSVYRQSHSRPPLRRHSFLTATWVYEGGPDSVSEKSSACSVEGFARAFAPPPRGNRMWSVPRAVTEPTAAGALAAHSPRTRCRLHGPAVGDDLHHHQSMINRGTYARDSPSRVIGVFPADTPAWVPASPNSNGAAVWFPSHGRKWDPVVLWR